MRLLVHCCCAPCAVPLIEYLLDRQLVQSDQLVLYYFNPNIQPAEEYRRRKSAMKKIAKFWRLRLIVPDYQPIRWFKEIQQSLPDPAVDYSENSQRCLVCFQIRLTSAAQYAQQHHFTAFTTTLSTSWYKDVKAIQRIGQKLAEQYKITFYEIPLDPGQVRQRSIYLSHQIGLYRQKYCGCLYSKKQ